MRAAWLTNHGAALECSDGAVLLQACRRALREWLAAPSVLRMAHYWSRREALCRVAPEKLLAMPSLALVQSDSDRVVELYDGCPECGSPALEALTWVSAGSTAVTVGCWDCGWHLGPGGEVRQAPDEPIPQSAIRNPQSEGGAE